MNRVDRVKQHMAEYAKHLAEGQVCRADSERFEDLELGSIRILNSAIAYLTQLESENAALKSRLERTQLAVCDVCLNKITCIANSWVRTYDKDGFLCDNFEGCAVEQPEVAALKSRLEEAESERDAIIAEVRRGIGCYACENEKTCELMIDAGECEQWTWRGAQVDGGGE